MATHDTDRLWSLARGTLSEDETARIRGHLRDCHACAQRLAQMQAAASTLIERTSTPPPLADEIWNKVDREVLASAQRVLGPGGTGVRGRWLGWALVGGVLAAASVLFIVGGRPSVEPQPRTIAERQAAPATEARPTLTPPASTSASPKSELGRVRLGSGLERPIGEGEEVATHLKDEAFIELRKARTLVLPSSLLKLAELNESRSRLLLVRGTVAVAANHGEPGEFIVTAGNVDVIVTGTRFLVTCSDDVVEIAVTEGVVRVRTASQEQRLVAGKALTLRRDQQNDQWSVRSLTKKELSILARMDPARSPPRRPLPGGSPTSGTVEIRPESLPSVDVGRAHEQLPTLSPPPPAQTAPLPEKPPQPSSEKEQNPAWRLPGVNEIPKGVTEHLPDGLQPKPSQTPDEDEYLIRKMEQLARAGDCRAALQRAEAWLRTHPTPAQGDSKQKNRRQAVQAVREQCR